MGRVSDSHFLIKPMYYFLVVMNTTTTRVRKILYVILTHPLLKAISVSNLSFGNLSWLRCLDVTQRITFSAHTLLIFKEKSKSKRYTTAKLSPLYIQYVRWLPCCCVHTVLEESGWQDILQECVCSFLRLVPTYWCGALENETFSVMPIELQWVTERKAWTIHSQFMQVLAKSKNFENWWNHFRSKEYYSKEHTKYL